jgi:parafibromin
MADILSLLREYVINKQLDQVEDSGGTITFGGNHSCDATTATAYKSSKGDFYDIRTLLFFARYLDIPIAEYRKLAKERGVPSITLLDRVDLRAYLSGAKDTSEHIVAGAAAEATVAAPTYAPGDATDAMDIATGQVADGAAEGAALRAIIANERQLRDRNTMLSLPGRSFKRVLEILDTVAQRYTEQSLKEEQRRRKEHATRARKAAEAARAQVVGPRPSGRYERETGDASMTALGGDLGVAAVGYGDAMQTTTAPHPKPPPPPPPTAAGAAAPSAPSAPPSVPPPPPPPPAARPSSDSQRRPPQPQPSSLKRKEPRQDSHQQKQKKHSHRHRDGASAQDSSRKDGPPLFILVPPAATALVNMSNAERFLVEGVYETPQQAKARKVPQKKRISLAKDQKQQSGRSLCPLSCDVMDQEPKPEDRERWKRVAAVICLGKPWQFKSWPFPGAQKGDLVEAFQKVCGVYFHYADEPIDPVVRQWNVRTIAIQRHSRDGDAAAVREFWAHLTAFLQARRSKLGY